ncbi:MAG: HAMP domain-containing sensor histidine kinase [Calditrichaceae bacterium]
MMSTIHNRKGNFKGILFIIGIALIITGIWYSHRLVTTLENKSTEYIKFRIKVFEAEINDPDSNADVSFLFNEVIQEGIDFPIIVTDPYLKPTIWKNISPKLDSLSSEELSQPDSVQLNKELVKIRVENDPIPIKAGDMVIAYYFYGYSPVIYKLQFFPFIAIGSAAIFIFIGYLGFSYIKKSEQQFIWVGMAKETAHQLGTPLSSIAGWLELLKLKPQMYENALLEIDNDLKRLNKIANRFSKIGSIPELKAHSLLDVINSVVDYFQKRLPNMQKRVMIETDIKKDIQVKINPELFEWVLENLIKNAMDAIGDKNGIIQISLKLNSEYHQAYIDIHDNGKGMSSKEKTNIFKPGYSTKKRGWGLGLSLARRIIEEYHGGKLFLKDAKPNYGSTFRIILNIAK